MHFSIIIPVYNRPDEVDELLASLCKQTDKRFEVILVEDGSMNTCEEIARNYSDQLSILYFDKPNSGPGLSRNAGAEKANFDYLVFFDSDCIIPPQYIENISRSLKNNYVDAFGGPDAALPTFTPIQKAINYSMTSFFTTGGIRGGKKSMDKFHPRSFNLGVSRAAFEAIGGYGKMRFGEDIDFSLRLIENDFTTMLIPESFVYHKRRTTFRQFFKQVFNSGIARINITLAHPNSLKLVHFLPAVFVEGMVILSILSIWFPLLLCAPILFSLIIFIDSFLKNSKPVAFREQRLKVAFLSVPAAWIQLVGYGLGFISAAWKRLVLRKGEFQAFRKKFYE